MIDLLAELFKISTILLAMFVFKDMGHGSADELKSTTRALEEIAKHLSEIRKEMKP